MLNAKVDMTPPEVALCQEQPALAGCALVESEFLLERLCGYCHSSKAPGGVRFPLGDADVDDIQGLVESGLLACDAEEPALIRAIRRGRVAPHECVLFPTEEATDAVWELARGYCLPR